jgi:histidine triad (HIT) family protein
MTTVFAQIIEGKIPCKKAFENERILAFHDIAPQAPVHIVIIPKKPITKLFEATEEDQALLGELLLVANQIAKEQKISEGFRLLTNSGYEAGQRVFHLHFHLLGGRPLSNQLG